ncbi:MAG: hypothetical protein AVDCRST_MAG02-3264, partial [uncultured Rubrobacteraceae bacterium]
VQRSGGQVRRGPVEARGGQGRRGPGRVAHRGLRRGQRSGAPDLLGPRRPAPVLDELPRHLRQHEERVPQRLRRRRRPRRPGMDHLRRRQRQGRLLRRREPAGDRRRQGQPLPRLLRPPHRHRTGGQL